MLTQFGADGEDGAEGPGGEVDVAVDVPQIGQLDPQSLVHGCEVDQRVRRDVVLIECPTGLVQPDVPLWPPHGMVRPVHGNVCKEKEEGL